MSFPNRDAAVMSNQTFNWNRFSTKDVPDEQENKRSRLDTYFLNHSLCVYVCIVGVGGGGVQEFKWKSRSYPDDNDDDDVEWEQ